MTIPEVAHGNHAFWERIGAAKEVTRLVSGREIRFFVQPTRADCVHACTVDDITHLLSLVPLADWEGMQAVVLRQPRRKEAVLASVWGRLSYAAELVNSQREVVYAGPAIMVEAVDPSKPLKFGKSLSLDGASELDRLVSDGHELRRGDRHHTLDLSLESCRATQLYRTIPHELGHWVDFLEKVERPSAAESVDYAHLLDRYHGRPTREKEHFAHAYAERLRKHLLAVGAIPFHRDYRAEQLQIDGLRLKDFMPNVQ